MGGGLVFVEVGPVGVGVVEKEVETVFGVVREDICES